MGGNQFLNTIGVILFFVSMYFITRFSLIDDMKKVEQGPLHVSAWQLVNHKVTPGENSFLQLSNFKIVDPKVKTINNRISSFEGYIMPDPLNENTLSTVHFETDQLKSEDEINAFLKRKTIDVWVKSANRNSTVLFQKTPCRPETAIGLTAFGVLLFALSLGILRYSIKVLKEPAQAGTSFQRPRRKLPVFNIFILLFLSGFSAWAYFDEADLRKHCKSEPTTMTAAQLAHNGSSDNWFVRVTDFTLKDITMKTHNGGIDSITCRLYPTGVSRKGDRVINLSASRHSMDDIKDLGNQGYIVGVVYPGTDKLLLVERPALNQLYNYFLYAAVVFLVVAGVVLFVSFSEPTR